jgi:hypothetical protein
MIGALLTVLAVSLAQPAARPPAFNPAQDAPHTVGQPGHLAPEPLPRSPHKRVLPPERGPGIWAGDEPKGSAETQPPSILDVILPVLDEHQSLPAVRRCVEFYKNALFREPNLAQRALRLTPGERLCVFGSLFTECLWHALREPKSPAVIRPAYDHAATRTKNACGGRYNDVKDLVNAIEYAAHGARPPPGGYLQ